MAQTAPHPRTVDDDGPLPRLPELVRLSMRIDRLLASDDDRDNCLAAKSLDYVAALTAEIDRVRPLRRTRAARST